jgi:hypothetical protein
MTTRPQPLVSTEVALEDCVQAVLRSDDCVPAGRVGRLVICEEERGQAMVFADEQCIHVDPLIRRREYRVAEVDGAIVNNRS